MRNIHGICARIQEWISIPCRFYRLPDKRNSITISTLFKKSMSLHLFTESFRMRHKRANNSDNEIKSIQSKQKAIIKTNFYFFKLLYLYIFNEEQRKAWNNFTLFHKWNQTAIKVVINQFQFGHYLKIGWRFTKPLSLAIYIEIFIVPKLKLNCILTQKCQWKMCLYAFVWACNW